MPLFDYSCPPCNIQKEETVKRYDDLVVCPECGDTMTKLACSPSFILKGVGLTSNGSFARAKEGPKIDKELLTLSDKDLNYECGLPENCGV